jgi:hypothetical protein
MRTYLMIAGLVLIIAGGFMLLGGASLTSTRSVLSVGELSVTAEERHPISPWIAGIVMVMGIGVLTTGILRKA